MKKNIFHSRSLRDSILLDFLLESVDDELALDYLLEALDESDDSDEPVVSSDDLYEPIAKFIDDIYHNRFPPNPHHGPRSKRKKKDDGKDKKKKKKEDKKSPYEKVDPDEEKEGDEFSFEDYKDSVAETHLAGYAEVINAFLTKHLEFGRGFDTSRPSKKQKGLWGRSVVTPAEYPTILFVVDRTGSMAGIFKECVAKIFKLLNKLGYLAELRLVGYNWNPEKPKFDEFQITSPEAWERIINYGKDTPYDGDKEMQGFLGACAYPDFRSDNTVVFLFSDYQLTDHYDDPVFAEVYERYGDDFVYKDKKGKIFYIADSDGALRTIPKMLFKFNESYYDFNGTSSLARHTISNLSGRSLSLSDIN